MPEQRAGNATGAARAADQGGGTAQGRRVASAGGSAAVAYRCVLERDGRITHAFADGRLGRLIGIDERDAETDPAFPLRLMPDADRQAYLAAVTEAGKRRTSFELNVRLAAAGREHVSIRVVAGPPREERGALVWDGFLLDMSAQRRAERELEEWKTRFHDFTRAASDWLWETDESYRFTYISERIIDASGLTAKSFVGRRRYEFVDPTFEPEKWREHLRMLEERRPFRDYCYRQRLESGQHRYVKISGRPVFDAEGKFRGYRGVGTEITAQMAAQQSAATATARLLSSFETLSEAVAIYDADDRLVLCNSRYRAINSAIESILVPGARFEDVVRALLRAGRFPDAVGDEEAWLRQHMERHRNPVGSFEQLTPEGRWLQVLEQKMPDDGTIILGTDVTPLKRREEALTFLTHAEDGSGPFFQAAAKALAVGLGYRWAGISSVPAGVGTAEMLAWSGDDQPLPADSYDLDGTPCGQVVRDRGFLALGSDVAEAFPLDDRLRALGAACYVGEAIIGADGASVGVVFGLNDKPDPDCEAKREITALIAPRVGFELHRIEAEQQLREAKTAAEAASRAKSEFLANMSHELRTPLNAIIGFSQMIAEEILGPSAVPKYRDYALDIVASSGHLLELINDVLDMSRIEAGKQELHFTAVNVGRIMESCCRLFRAKAEAMRISLSVDVATKAPVIEADERVIRQILLNILSNAVKFTPEGGEIAAGVSTDEAGRLLVTVRDTGIGVAPEDLDKIFKPFGQVDSSIARKFEGTGLGLVLTRGLVELHGGTLTFESEPGRGTTVTVSLPRAHGERPFPAGGMRKGG
jgi:PAS domain S-box-containing protein